MELTGTIKSVFDEKQISANFRKRELVLTTEERYPQQILVEFTQDKIQLLEDVRAGQQVTISINIRGREWTSPQGQVKYFVSVQGWKIRPAVQEDAGYDAPPVGGAPPPGGPPARDEPPLPDGPNDYGAKPIGDDDIPF